MLIVNLLKDKVIISKINKLLNAYDKGLLGDTTMPEDTHPDFINSEDKLVYYTLPMALNYQRNSYKLWESAKMTWEDKETKGIYILEEVTNSKLNFTKDRLLKYRLGLQPNKHTDTWVKISRTIYTNWESISNLMKYCDNDFINLRDVVQNKQKKGFPYLSGPKIFNYWSYILTKYGNIKLKNRSLIEIAPDTHVIQASVKLGIILPNEILKISRDEISLRWREILKNTEIDPIDVHSPLWFWSRGKFKYKV